MGDYVMMKQVKWNKKRKWINTRYAKAYKVKQAIKRMLAAQAYAIGSQIVKEISATKDGQALSRVSKRTAISDAVSCTQRAVQNIFNS